MANISNDEKNMVGLPVEGEEEEEEEEEGDEEEEEEEEGNTYNQANIPAEKEPEAAEETSEQEPTFTGYLPPPRDEHAEEIEVLRNQN